MRRVSNFPDLASLAPIEMKPNFLIVGAPKCGTTAMWKYLQDHPDVFLSPRKDMHYFGSDLQFTKRQRFSQTEYLHFFREATEKAVGEASVWYLYSKNAAAEIHRFDPSMKIIIMLRDPVQMMYAHYTQMRFNGLGDENLTTFEEALDAEEDRKQGRRIPKENTLPQALFYREIGKLAEQIQRYQQFFPPEQILYLFQEDMKDKMAQMYRETLSFLQVDPNHPMDFPRINRHKVVRFEWVRKSISIIPQSFKQKLPVSARKHLSKRIRKINSKHAKRAPLQPDLAQILRKERAEDILFLSQTTGRDLQHWK